MCACKLELDEAEKLGWYSFKDFCKCGIPDFFFPSVAKDLYGSIIFVKLYCYSHVINISNSHYTSSWIKSGDLLGPVICTVDIAMFTKYTVICSLPAGFFHEDEASNIA